MKSLNALGVTSKDALRAVLMQLRMLPSHGEGGAKQDWLDIQLYRLRTQRQTSIATNNDWIWRWLRHVDGKCYGTPVDRPASSLITLVPPPVFNDVEVPEFLKKAKERMEKKYGSVFMRRGGLFEGRRERLVGWEVGSERGR
ncbi:hypothetical protein HK097_009619 [Rhizophlyctis rosea]|uniref:Uncharacterized protein n=1 Tax=Rhizophlyctis rosea TaxID=64517 RepID=A0AAD5SAA6_9FUNG|nr:hypothetical protein HK097_009619 [Rhizophlyctis rosea]